MGRRTRRLHCDAPISAGHEDSNNLLAVELERENDASRDLFPEMILKCLFSLKLKPRQQHQGFLQMVSILKRVAVPLIPAAAVVFAIAAPALAQQPTDAQRSAIRAECSGDYEKHCASIPPGGAASLQCLQKNMSSLSASCQRAVSAVGASTAAPSTAPSTAAPSTAAPSTAAPSTAAAPKAGSAAAPATTSAKAGKPTDAQVAAVRSACRSDYQKTCAGVPTGGAAALQCLETNKSKLSAGCQQAVAAASGGAGGAPAAAAAGSDAAPAAAPALVLRPMRPREELFVVRSACGGDVRSLCGGIAPGGGRIAQCLARQAASLSPACKEVLAQFAAR